MKFEFKYELTESEIKSLLQLYHSVSFTAIEQHPSWHSSIEPHKKIIFFIASENGVILCSAIISETFQLFTKTAEILFGPLSADKDILIESIREIRNYYKNAGFTALTVQLPFPTGPVTDYIEYKLNRTAQVKQFFDRNNWSSIGVDLSITEKDLLGNLSKGHKSDIKKGIKNELKVLHNFTDTQFNDFIEIYINMHKERGLPVNAGETKYYFHNVNQFFKTHEAGKFLLVADAEEKILGGIAIVRQNKTVRYYKGAADPQVRNLPVLHMAIWDAIITSKNEGFEFFDLWGYNHFVDESDQVFFINRFKKGFGGDFIFYPKKIYFIFRPIAYKAFNNIKAIYKRYLKKKIQRK